MTRRWTVCTVCLLASLPAVAAPAGAQSVDDVGVRGFGIFGTVTFTAKDSFDAILDQSGGPIFGGGGQVLFRRWNVYVEVAAWRFKQDGERVFIGPNDEVFGLGIPAEVTVTPFEITGGYRFTLISPKFTPYAGGGFSSYRYEETSEFADPEEDVDERFSGFHIQAGAEYHVLEWLAVAGEVGWASVADALGDGGVSEHYREDNLGGTSLRVKITIGR